MSLIKAHCLAVVVAVSVAVICGSSRNAPLYALFWLTSVDETLLQAVIESLVKANTDYTIVINGIFFGYMWFCKLASPSSMSPVTVFAGGNTKGISLC